jgi:predicted RND superfamily exporter protein
VRGLYSIVDGAIPDSFIPEYARETFVSPRYTFLNITITSDMEGKETASTIKSIRSIASSYFKDWYLTGEPAVYLDLQEVTSRDFNNVTILSILLIGLILVVTFKSIFIPLILIFVIQLGIWINLSMPYFQGLSLNFISFIIIGAIQLGATVDYAILFTSRYKENLGGLSRKEAIRKTIDDTGKSVLTSALILMAGTFSVSFITTIRSAAELTLLIGRGAVISLILVYILLPSLLLIFDRVIRHTTIGWPQKTGR